jgi:hypothetical protein
MLYRRTSFLYLIASLSICMLLFVGCGGSSGSSSSGSSISGVVADGYLAGARVFLDLNGNRIWDSGEPYTTSNADGTYTISDITVDNYNSYPVVAEVTVSTTDQDTGMPVSHAYTLVSPAGHPEFVSPLTTMIQVGYEGNPGITIDQAQTIVKGLLSMDNAASLDLFSDYVDKELSDTDYAKLHNIAQLSARLMGANISAIESAAESEGVVLSEAKDEILRIAVKEIMQSMNTIEDTATEETGFDADQEVQTLDVMADTSNVADNIAAEAAAAQYQAPSASWATIFRNHDSGGITDFLCLGLAHDMDLTGYTFSATGPDDTEYIFGSGDRYTDSAAPIAWAKYLPDLPEGEYIFYVTMPGGEKVELGRDTHVHTVIPELDLASAYVVKLNGALSRLYHDTLEGTYYYRMLIRNSATSQTVYTTTRKERNIEEFPSEYAAAGYQYRVEVWDKPVFKDATARYRTAWSDMNPSGPTDTYVAFYNGYRRIRYTNGTPSNRLVLDIAITHPDNLNSLTVSSPGGNPLYTFDLSQQPGVTSNSGNFYFTRFSGTTEDGTEYGDYFLQIMDNMPNGVYTFNADVISGDDISQTITIYNQTALPCVDKTTVSATEDQNGQITVDWDPVNWSGKPVFYRVTFTKNEDWDNQYCTVRIPATTWTGNRDDIEATIGGSLDDNDVGISVWVIDSQYPMTIHNRTDFAPAAFTIN